MKKWFVASILVLSGINLAWADTAPAKAQTCVACHGPAGVSSYPEWPNLAGQKEQYLAKAIGEYKSGTRSDATMKAMVAALSDADVANLAAYFSGQACK